MFVTAGDVQNFARVARKVELEVFVKTDLDVIEDFPEGFKPGKSSSKLSYTLYATMPTLDTLRHLLSLRVRYQETGNAGWDQL